MTLLHGRSYRRPARRETAAGTRRLTCESLESRLVLYALSGYSWAASNITASFVPDGTPADPGYTSSLFSKMNSVAPTATWQREFARALQTWAVWSNLNFRIVSDNGAGAGTSGSVQGDSRFGDIRLFANPLGTPLASTYYPCCDTNGGDVYLNPSYTYQIGGTYDFYSVMLHEIGHAIGLRHSDSGTVMYGTYSGIKTDLASDDIAGVQAIYGARRPDSFDAAAANDSFGAASALTLSSLGSVTASADLTRITDVDYYRVTVPAGSDGTLTVSVDARNLSLLAGKVWVYDSNQTLVASVGADLGGVATVSLSGLVAGQTYYVVADRATSDVFGIGAYKLTVSFGGLSGGGGGGGDGGGGGGGGTISPDLLEVNDTTATATNLGRTNSASKTGLTVHSSTDLDYFVIVPSKSGTFTVTSTFTAANGNLDLAIYNSQGTVLANGTSTSNNEVVTVSMTGGVQYYVKVLGVNGATNTYDFSIAKTGGSRPQKIRAHPNRIPLADTGKLREYTFATESDAANHEDHSPSGHLAEQGVQHGRRDEPMRDGSSHASLPHDAVLATDGWNQLLDRAMLPSSWLLSLLA